MATSILNFIRKDSKKRHRIPHLFFSFFLGGGGWVSYLIFRNNSLNIKFHKTKNNYYFKVIHTDMRYFVLDS